MTSDVLILPSAAHLFRFSPSLYMPSPSFLRLLVVLCLTSLACSNGWTANLVWTNGSSGNWNVAANWSPNQVPAAADQAFITNAGTYSVTVSDSRTVASLTLGGGSGTQGVALSAGTLTLGTGSRVVVGGKLTMTGGVIAGALNIANTGLMLIEGNTTKRIGATVTNLGTIQLTGGGDLYLGSTLENQGLFTMGGGTRVLSDFLSPQTFRNKGTLRKIAEAGTADVGVSSQYGIRFENTGTVENQQGTLRFYGGGALEGTFTTLSGARIELTGGTYAQPVIGKPTVSGAGVTVMAGGTLRLKTEIPGLVMAGGVLELERDGQGVATIDSLTLDGITLGGTNVVAGTLRLRSGTIGGILTIANGGSILVEGSSTKRISATVTNFGTVQLTGGGDLYLGSTLENQGLFTMGGGTRVLSDFLDPQTFRNKGTLRKIAEAGTVDVGVSSQYGIRFENTGTVESQQGTLRFYGGGALDGTFATLSGARIELTGGTYAQPVIGKPTVSGAGVTVMAGGTLRLKREIPGLVMSGGVLELERDGQGVATIDSLTLDGITLGGTNVVTGTLRLRSGTIGGVLTIANGGSILVEGSFTKRISATVTNFGTVQLTGGGDLYLGSTLENQGLFTMGGGTRVLSDFLDPQTFRNKGTFRKIAEAGTADVGVSSQYGIRFENTGTVESQQGTLRFYGGGALEGTFTTLSGARIELTGGTYAQPVIEKPTVSGAGVTVMAGGTLRLKSEIPGLVMAGGVLELERDGQGVATIESLTLDGITLSGTNVVAGTLRLRSGTIGGILTIANGGSILVEGSSTKRISATVTNFGTVQLTGGGDLYLGSTLENQGLFTMGGGTRVLSDFLDPQTFRNKGTFRKIAEAGTADVGVSSQYGIRFENTGTLESQQGTLRLYGGGVLEGVITTASGARIELTGGTYVQTVAGKPVVTGAGVAVMTGGTLRSRSEIPGLVLAGGVVELERDNQGVATIESLTVDGTTLSGTNVVTGTLRFRSGTIAGVLTIANNGLMLIEGSNTKRIAATVTNVGTMKLSGSGDLYLGSSLENQGLFEVEGGTRILSDFLQPRTFRNKGVLRKVGGSATADVGVSSQYGIVFENTGTVDVRRGSLSFFGGYTQAGASLSLGLSAASGYGSIALPGAISLDGTLSVYLMDGYVPVANNKFSVLSFGSSSGAFDAVNLPDGVNWQTTYGTQSVSLSVSNACYAPPSGLVAWWSGEGDAQDLQGFNSGSLKNGASFSSGRIGSAFRLDGVNDFVEVANSASLNPKTISLAAWVNPSVLKPGGRIVSKDLSAGSCGSPFIAYSMDVRSDRGNKAAFYLTTTNGSLYEVLTTSTVPTNTFTHLTATYDGLVARIYFNGALQSTVSAPGELVSTATPVLLGAGGAGCRAASPNTTEFAGLLDEVQLFNRALSSAEVSGLFNASVWGVCRPIEPPVVLAQPQSRSATAGSTVSFSVSVAGLPGFRYQWLRNGSPLADAGGVSGSQSNLLTLAGLQKSQGGVYSVTVENFGGSVESLPAVLKVESSLATPELVPASVEVVVGQAFAFSVQGGSAPYVFSMPTNRSGATIGGQNGVYVAGTQPGVVDTIQVTDSKGASAQAAVTVITDPTPRPDLAVHQISLPSQALPGASFPVSWIITNRGPATAVAPWQDYVLLSVDATVGSDTLLGGLSITQSLAGFSSLSVTQQVTVPVDGPSGNFRLVVLTDANASVQESNEVNNATVSLGGLFIPQQLVLSLAVSQLREDAPNPNVLATLRRNGNTAPTINVSLASSAPDELEVPPVVVLPAGQQAINFLIAVKPDGIFDGNQTVQLTASAAGFTTASASFTVLDADSPALTIGLDQTVIVEGAGVIATVGRPATASSTPVTATLTTSGAGEFTFPAIVSLAAGQLKTNVVITSLNDNLIEQTNTYFFTVKAAGYLNGNTSLMVIDNDLPSVSMALVSTSVSESAGGNATSLVISRQPASLQALQLLLSSADTNVIRVPVTAFIPSGQSTVTIPIAVVNNLVADGSRVVAIGAWVREGESGGIVDELPPVVLTVTDDEGPTLNLSLGADAVGEGLSPATTGIVTRNTPVTSPLIVALSSSDVSEAAVPASVTIPAGTNVVTFPIATVLDGVLDGSQTVGLTASATGFNPGKANLVVSDADLADLAVAFVRHTNSAATADSIDVTYRIENRGNRPAVGPFSQRIFISPDPVFGDDVLASQTEFGGSLPPGEFFESTLRLKLPNQAGNFWFIVQTDQGNAVSEILEGNNVFVPSLPVTLTPAYSVTVAASPGLAPGGTPVTLSGKATRPGGVGAGFEVVALAVQLRGTERHFQALTDAQGNYSLVFQPLPGEGGHYEVIASHPGVANTVPQAEFTLLAMKAGTPTPIRLVEGESGSGTVAIHNLADVPLSGLQVSVVQSPTEIAATPSLGNDFIVADGVVVLGYAVSVANGVNGSSGFRLRVESAEGAVLELVVPVTIDAKRARLVAFPGSLEGGMKRGTQRVVEFGITNVGGLTTGPIKLLTPNVSWLNLASSRELAPLDPGAGARVSVVLTPPSDLPLGAHGGTIAINASNTVLSVPYSFRSLSDSIGALRILSVDEYTYYAEGAPRVSNAVVRLTDAITGGVITTNSGPAGELLLPSLVESYYYVDVTAPDHSSFRDLVLVEPGKTNLVTGLMSRQSVKYTWTVVPIQIEDRYTITVETIFETAVPKPVVTIEPAIIDLANFVGTEQQVNLTLKNHGLIAAQNTHLSFPTHSLWSFTPLITDVGVLPAQSTLVIPLTIRKLANGAISLAQVPSLAGTTRDSCSLPAKVEWDTPCGDTAIHNSISLGLISLIPLCGSGNGGEGNGEGQDILGGLGGGGGGGGGPADLQATAYPTPIFHDVPYKCDPCEQARFNHVVLHCVTSWIPYSDLYDLLSEGGDALLGGPPPLTLASGPSLAGAGASARECIQDMKKAFSWAGTIKDCKDAYAAYQKGDTAKAVTGGLKCSQLPSCNPGGGWLIKAIECELELMQLPECKGRGLGGSGGPPPMTSTPSLAEVPAEVVIDPFDSAAPLLLAGQRLLRVFGPSRNFFGDDEWLLSTNRLAINVWLARVGDATEAASAEGTLISASERQALLAGVLPVPTDLATRFVDRIQRTLQYANRGITRVSQVPTGESTDFIDASEMVRLTDLAEAALAQIEGEGYPSPVESLLIPMRDYVNHMRQSSGGAVCARVKVRLDQEAVLTRDAFNARLEINNETTDSLEELAVELHVRTLDGRETTSLFQIRNPELTGISAVNGTGIIPPRGDAVASWVIVPTSEAAPTNTVQHFVSGTLRYRQKGVLVSLPLSPAPIDVLPNPKLVVKYFHERDVFSDDPLTPEVEPAVPYSLAVLVSNEGYGIARQMRITSAQPKIVDNEKGLLIDFEIVGSEVAGQSSTPSLSVSLGDIPPLGNTSARWLFRSSLQGLFTDYSATFEHLDGLGDKRLSLIDRVEIHEMNHVVRADRSFEDGKLDFLVNDVPDFDDLPDTLHLSSGGTRPVIVFNQGVPSAVVTAYQLTITLATPTSDGWAYFRVPDPSAGKYRIASVRRADNSLVPLNNVWQTDRTFIGLGNPPRREARLHLLDFQPAGTYTLTYQGDPTELDTIAPISKVNPIPSSSREAFSVTWDGTDTGSGIAGFDVFVKTNNGAFGKLLDRTSLKGLVFEGQAGSRYAFYTVAIDLAGNREAAPAIADAETLVSITNSPPVAGYPPSLSLDEGSALNLIPTLREPGSPGVPVSFELITAPPGVTIQAGNGQLSWLTGEGNGPSTNQVWVRVGYPGFPLLNATSRLAVIVREINRGPELDFIPDAVTTAGFLFAFDLEARDFDLPANQLTYALVSGAKPGVTLNAATGRFSWRPESLQAPSTNRFVVSVSDNASPALTASRSFTLVVRERRTDFSLALGTTNLFGGEQSSIPLRLTTGVELQELSFTISQLEGRLSNLTLTSLAPEITSAILEPLANGNARVRLSLNGLVSADQYALARLRFTGPTNIPSALIRLQPTEVAGVDYDGNTLRRASVLPGIIALVNREPVVYASSLPQPLITVYGLAGKTYQIETRSSLLPGTPWQPYNQAVLIGRSLQFEINPTEIESFFRALEK